MIGVVGVRAIDCVSVASDNCVARVPILLLEVCGSHMERTDGIMLGVVIITEGILECIFVVFLRYWSHES